MFFEASNDVVPEVTDADLIAIALNDLGVSYLKAAKRVRENGL
jgi:hypothetical protein